MILYQLISNPNQNSILIVLSNDSEASKIYLHHKKEDLELLDNKIDNNEINLTSHNLC